MNSRPPADPPLELPGGEPPPTLGQRLAAAAVAAMDRRRAVVSWLDRATAVLDRAGELADVRAGRFARVEVAPGRWASADGFLAATAAPVAGPGGAFGDGTGPTAGHLARHVAADVAGPVADHAVALPAALRERLAPLVGSGPAGVGLDGVRIHQDGHADALTRAHGAAAVTVGQEIYFRTGRFRPDTADGRALLAHELTHVAAGQRPGSAWRRASAAGVADDEQAAEAAATAARSLPAELVRPVAGRSGSGWPGPGSGLPTGRAPLPAVPDPPGHPSAHPTSAHLARPDPRPRATPAPTAAAAAPTLPAGSRPMAAPDRPAGTAATAVPAGPDLQALRESVRRDLLRTLRTDAERGG